MTAFHFGDDAAGGQINGGESTLSRPCNVESHASNAFGLHDTHGNVNEWCYDWFEDLSHDMSPLDDPVGPVTSSYHGRVIRGGGYLSRAERCTSVSRAFAAPDEVRPDVGLRVVRTIGSVGQAHPDTVIAQEGPLGDNLLDSVNPTLHADSRPWEHTEEGLVANNLSGASFLTIPGSPPAEYDLHIELTLDREAGDPGNDTHISIPAFQLPDRRQAYPFVIRRVGEDTLLSFWPSSGDEPSGEEPYGVTLNDQNPFETSAKLTFEVRTQSSQSIRVLLNDEPQFVLVAFGNAVNSSIPFIKLGSWQNRVIFHSVVLEPIVEEAE